MIQNAHLRAVGGDQSDCDIRHPAVAERHRHVDMFDAQAGAIDIDHQCGSAEIGNGQRLRRGVRQGNRCRLVGRVGGHITPDLGHSDGRQGVDHAVSIALVIGHAAAVPVFGTVGEPAVHLVPRRCVTETGPCLRRRGRKDILDIAPMQVRIRLEHQRSDAGDHGRGRRGSAKGAGRVPERIAGAARQVSGNRGGRCGHQDVMPPA